MLFNEYIKASDNSLVMEAFNEAKLSQEKLNAVVTFVEPEEQLKNVKEGKLKNVPIFLKDNVNTKGIKTTASSKILENYVPIYDAAITTKLKDAGAIILGKSSMDELAMGGTNTTAVTGPVYNPYDKARMAGGSSGGSCALVAAGIVPMAIGSDTGDSVRKPAAYCGIIGVKPTYGRISRYGIIPYSSSLDHVGYFTRCVEDACTSLEVLQGRDDRDMTSSYKLGENYLEKLNSDMNGKKILVFKNVTDAITTKETMNSFNKIVEGLKKRGALVEEVSFNEDLMRALLPAYYIIANCEATANHSNLDGIRFGNRIEGEDMIQTMINTRTQGFGPLIRKRFVIGSYGLFEENQERLLKQAQRIRRLVVNALNEKLKDADGLLAPSSGDVAPLIENHGRDELTDEYLIAENYMSIANFSGYPSMSLPMGFKDGLPLGINITCNAWDEMGMFNLAKAIEEITGYKDLSSKEVK
jgi:aspartyl-tRNA(Asn)/glutamyl-tRNA(Gln) amidotransferase subunit A